MASPYGAHAGQALGPYLGQLRALCDRALREGPKKSTKISLGGDAAAAAAAARARYEAIRARLEAGPVDLEEDADDSVEEVLAAMRV